MAPWVVWDPPFSQSGNPGHHKYFELPKAQARQQESSKPVFLGFSIPRSLETREPKVLDPESTLIMVFLSVFWVSVLKYISESQISMGFKCYITDEFLCTARYYKYVELHRGPLET